MKTVGILAPSMRAKELVTLEPFFAEMRRLGWVESENVVYDWALGDDQEQALSRKAAELVARKPDLIYAPPAPAASAARRATAVIPIVFATGTDPVGAGLVQSLGRPGGNVTGAISVADSLAPKLVQMLREINRRTSSSSFQSADRQETRRGAGAVPAAEGRSRHPLYAGLRGLRKEMR